MNDNAPEHEAEVVRRLKGIITKMKDLARESMKLKAEVSSLKLKVHVSQDELDTVAEKFERIKHEYLTLSREASIMVKTAHH